MNNNTLNKALITAAMLLTGCAQEAPPAPPVQTPARSAKPEEKPALATQPGSEAVEDSEVPDQPVDARVAEAQKAYEGSPSEETKVAYVKALVANADHYMYKSPLPPPQKYPKALAYYRQAQKLEPGNERVKESIETIEAIYRSIGKEIPKESV